MENKLPRLNSYVYVITYVDFQPYCISRDKVYMKSKDAFITEDMLNYDVIEEYRYSLEASDYGDRWVYTLKEAKEVVRQWAEYWDYDFDIKKNYEDSWCVDIMRKNGTLI